MKIQMQLVRSFFSPSHAHNYYLVREWSCICVKINFFTPFKLSSLAEITTLNNEPFMFQYPEGGAWINIFNCSFCGEIPSMKKVQNVLLDSKLLLLFIFTIPSLKGLYLFPGEHRPSIYSVNIQSTVKRFSLVGIGPIIRCQQNIKHFSAMILPDSVTFCLSASRGHLVNVYLFLIEARAAFMYNFHFQSLVSHKNSVSSGGLTQICKLKFFSTMHYQLTCV